MTPDSAVDLVNGKKTNPLQGIVCVASYCTNPSQLLVILALLGRGTLGGSVFLISFQEDLPPRA